MQKNILKIEDLDLEIYRIFSYKWFIELLKSKKNGLVRTSKWDDPFENFFLKSKFKDENGELIDAIGIANSWYGQCWSKTNESDALWRIYSPEKNGIKIKTTVKKLFSNFYRDSEDFASLKYLIGAVQYYSRNQIEESFNDFSFMDLASGGQPHNFAKTLLTKRLEFNHENEIRLLYCDSSNKFADTDVVKFDFPWEKIIEEIVLDPRMSSDEFDKYYNEIDTLVDSKIKISQSELYKVTFPSRKL